MGKAKKVTNQNFYWRKYLPMTSHKQLNDTEKTTQTREAITNRCRSILISKSSSCNQISGQASKPAINCLDPVEE